MSQVTPGMIKSAKKISKILATDENLGLVDLNSLTGYEMQKVAIMALSLAESTLYGIEADSDENSN